VAVTILLNDDQRRRRALKRQDIQAEDAQTDGHYRNSKNDSAGAWELVAVSHAGALSVL